MKVNIDDKIIKISFRHDVEEGVTNCYVRDNFDEIIDIGQAFKHPNDSYCYATGRRVALTQAIMMGGREFRKAVWTQYFKEHNDLRAKNTHHRTVHAHNTGSE